MRPLSALGGWSWKLLNLNDIENLDFCGSSHRVRRCFIQTQSESDETDCVRRSTMKKGAFALEAPLQVKCNECIWNSRTGRITGALAFCALAARRPELP